MRAQQIKQNAEDLYRVTMLGPAVPREVYILVVGLFAWIGLALLFYGHILHHEGKAK